jgi:regulator of sigma E protease
MDLVSLIANLLLIVLGFGFLIFVHELGHFVAAKWAGIRTEAFAIGMGPVALSYRRGIGLTIGSTWPAVETRIRQHFKSRGMTIDQPAGSPEERREQINRGIDALGLGETEYSLRWLPIGGFVKMLGQEDANPNYVSDDPRSYNLCPVPKRMVVVSAGVIANVLLAIVLFVIAFMVGVRFEDTVIGDVAPSMPAAEAMADNAAAAGVTELGLRPGDRVTHIDDEPAHTFADLQIAGAMGRPGRPLALRVARPGVDLPLNFNITPRRDPASGLLAIGVAPAFSTRLDDWTTEPAITAAIEESGIAEAGVEPGMRMIRAAGRAIGTYEEFAQVIARSRGEPVETQWTDQEQQPGRIVTAQIGVRPAYVVYTSRDAEPDTGLLGFSPLVRVRRAAPGTLNEGRLRGGDLLIGLGVLQYPRRSELFASLAQHKGETIEVHVLRDGQRVVQRCDVSRSGMLEIEIELAEDVPLSARPIETYARYRPDGRGEIEDARTPLADEALPGGVRVLAVNGRPVGSWPELRALLQAAAATSADAGAGSGSDIVVTIEHPTPGREHEDLRLSLDAGHARELRELAWTSKLPDYVFEPLRTTRSAGGNPFRAVAMGFEETHKAIVMTYLTLDRLFRRSVGIEQLRGPVGIVHLGTHVAQRGLTYVIFFLAMISVNLAVINFLPMPIVDGGLFLFLIYERFKGRPPSLAFQNAATIVGLCLLGAIFLVTFYNDVMRLIS